jgi:hypothetical protein
MSFMNFKNFSLPALCAIVFLASCSKDGKDGIDGVNGKTMLTRTTKIGAGTNCTYGGTKIEAGIDANNNGTLEDSEVTTTQTQYVCDGAGAIYSNWIDINVSVNSAPYSGEENYGYYQQVASSAITADVVNKGVILMYYKNKAGYVMPVEREDIDPIQDADVSGNSFEIAVGYIFKQNYLAFLANNTNNGNEASLMNANGSAVRYVIIPGNTQGRSVAELQKMPYSEVAKLYNIAD